jgi:hypothetical protein
MSQNLVCHTCQGTDFYEDRHGSFTCQRCGALSQDFFAESHDVEELLATRGMRTIKRKVGLQLAICSFALACYILFALHGMLTVVRSMLMKLPASMYVCMYVCMYIY